MDFIVHSVFSCHYYIYIFNYSLVTKCEWNGVLLSLQKKVPNFVWFQIRRELFYYLFWHLKERKTCKLCLRWLFIGKRAEVVKNAKGKFEKIVISGDKIQYVMPETDRLLKYRQNNGALSINTPVNFYLNTWRHITAHFYFKIQNILQKSFL